MQYLIRQAIRQAPHTLWQFVLAPEQEEPLDLLDGLIAEIKRHPAMLIDRYPAVAWRKRIASRRLFVKLRPDRHYAPDWIQAARELLESAFY